MMAHLGRSLGLLGLLGLLVVLACGSKDGSEGKRGHAHTKGCQGADLVEPWKQFSFPIEGGRVCRSTEQKTEVEYLTKTRAELEAAYEAALVGKGYTKEKCHDSKGLVPRCFYFKSPPTPRHEVTVDVHAHAESSVGPKDAKLVIVTVTTQGGSYQP